MYCQDHFAHWHLAHRITSPSLFSFILLVLSPPFWPIFHGRSTIFGFFSGGNTGSSPMRGSNGPLNGAYVRLPAESDIWFCRTNCWGRNIRCFMSRWNLIWKILLGIFKPLLFALPRVSAVLISITFVRFTQSFFAVLKKLLCVTA